MFKHLPLYLLPSLLMLTACASAPTVADSRNTPEAANRRPTPTVADSRQHLLGAYGQERDLTNADLLIFKTAVRNTKARDMTPYAVSSQVVAGMNYRFRCRAPLDETTNAPEATYIVTIFNPLPHTKLPPRVTAIDCINY